MPNIINPQGIREMQTKITMRSHLVPVRMSVIKKKKISVGKDMEKLEPLYTVGENVKWYSLYEKQFDSSSKN